MESVIVASLAVAFFAALVCGSVWAKRKKVTALVTPENHPAKHPYATPPDKFTVWPADVMARAAPKERARTMALHDAVEPTTERGME